MLAPDRTNRTPTWAISLLPWCLIVAAVTGQAPTPEPLQVDPTQSSERNYQGSYSAPHSRELFRCCDRNSDDRLDVLETAKAFDLMRSPKDHQNFARFDVDRDGFVAWQEFDKHFRRRLQDGGTFRVRTCRPLVLPDPPPQPLTALEKFHRLYDSDGDGGLSTEEIEEILKQLKLPESMGALLKQADINNSGKLEMTELAPLHEAFPMQPAPTTPQAIGGLKQPWLEADINQDKAIDAIELTALLRRLDPGLLRWKDKLLASRDSNGDGKLSAKELQAATAKKPPQDTKPAPGPAKPEQPQR